MNHQHTLVFCNDCSIGRQSSLCIAAMLMLAAAIANAFTPYLWLYLIMRVINGAGACGVNTIGFVLSNNTLQRTNYC